MLVNLGTPDHPEPKSVKKYLKQFLSDPRVIDYPPWLWQLILNFVILPFRSKKVAKLYHKIWLKDGSPLRVLTYKQAEGIAHLLQTEHGLEIAVEVAMTYGSPSIDTQLNKLMQQGVERIVVLPLFPQYSATTTAAVYDGISAAMAKIRNLPELRFIKHYAHCQDYLDVLADSVREFSSEGYSNRLLMFSFHGLPERYIRLGDPYQQECEATARGVAAKLGLNTDQYVVCYQSRVGKEQWLKPYTDVTLASLPAQGITKVDVICPAFATDCLETLEEIAIENREIFKQAGGLEYRYIPALNDSPKHIGLLTQLLVQQFAGDVW